MMEHPFQCLQVVESSSGQGSYLISACGPKLSSTCLTSGSILSAWTAGGEDGQQNELQNPQNGGEETTERPAKKQKTAASPQADLPKVIKLTVSPNSHYAVAVTEDKCVRVLEIQSDGRLVELSSRAMPKRPCAIQVLPDNSTILCGDKFGDVYSLPLLPKPEDDEHEQMASSTEAVKSPAASGPSFKPSATDKTVHTKRNLKSLEAQMKQKKITPKSKEPLAFEHQLLLGHVSVLTDLTYASCHIDGKQRDYIITSDRDEHIRVSRGPPQSHIIEGYCLGHTKFVSKIYALPSCDLLVSGGGDDWINVWDWPNFTLRWKFESFGKDIRQAQVQGGMSTAEMDNIAVSGIWPVAADLDGGPEGVVVVACEKMTVLAYCPVAELRDFRKGWKPNWSFERFDFPILDVAYTGLTTVVSFDARYKSHERLKALKLKITRDENNAHSVSSEGDEAMQAVLNGTHGTTSNAGSEKELDDFLYTIASMRKRANHDEAAAEDED